MRAQIHFEVFARRAGGRSFNLELATEDRELALDTAEAMLTEGGFVAVKVSKETLDPGTGEFKSVSIFNKGDLGKAKPKVDDEDRAPPCVSPADPTTSIRAIGSAASWKAGSGATTQPRSSCCIGRT